MSEGYDNNNRGACWPIDKAFSVSQTQIDNRKFYGALVRTGAQKASAPTHKLYLEAADNRSEVYCVAIFKNDKGGPKLAGGELKLRSGQSFWVALFKNKSENERAPTIDLSFQAKEAQQTVGQADTQTDDEGPDGFF